MASKHQSQVQNDPIAPPDEYQNPAQRPWRASVIRRLPWDGLLAFFAAIACGALMIVVIKISDGDLVSNWAVSPAVYLSIISVVSNVSLHYAFSRGVDISWWNAAMKPNTKVHDLHNIWLYSTSLRSAFFAGRSFNLVALSAILLAVLPANAPLAQRASRTVTRTTTSGATVPIVAAPKLGPGMETGMMATRGSLVAFAMPSFSKVLQNHLVSAPIAVPQGCAGGACKGIINGAGLEISCTSSSRKFDKLNHESLDILGPDGTRLNQDTIVFGTEINHPIRATAFRPGEPAINMSTVFNEKGGCAGTVEIRNCTLTPATLAYHVVVTNGTVALDGAYSYRNDSVVSYFETPGAGSGQMTYYGGLVFALQGMFTSKVGLSFSGYMRTVTDGLTALRYQRQLDVTNPKWPDCIYYWQDPTEDVLATIRQIAFRMAFEANVTGVAVQEMQAERQTVEVVYQSDYLFLGLSLMLIGLSAVAVVPLMWKWWRLGREVSLSPMETARAFGAHELVPGSGSNSSASELMGEVGSREVRYGEVVYGQYGGPTVTALAFAHPTMVSEPRRGAVY
ncbi:hypothetical protein B0T18DRAFT_443495 [Schizothecium vesticola]|uniref:Uncharacterized protein n=1 Tax=Schizothecium vesticola TaxID=314040 RepID=A0AA40F422_9PEZI|nr:hypothetical protein B0T18DRAFT_443495 [Schizothecium vesticola]